MDVRNQRLKPLKRYTGSNLADLGRIAVHAHRWWATPGPGEVAGPGGHEEGLRRTRGDAAGAKLATDPVDRCAVNVGSVFGRSRRLDIQVSSGSARRRLSGQGRGGAVVVVRGRESRSHGEGRQRVATVRLEG